jgi:hypothetical protein
MGLFSKLKADMNHGGITVQVQTPSSVASNQVIPVTVNITAKSPQTINSVKVELKSQAREQAINFNGGMGGVEEGRTTAQTVGEVESREPFTISPGETKTINLELYVSGVSGTGNAMGQFGGTNGAVGGALQALASVAQNFEHVTYLYTIHASADVDGVSMNPSDNQPIQLLPATAIT